MLPVAVARSSSDDNAMRYALPVLLMTSCFHVMVQIQTQAIGELFTVTRPVVPGAKSAVGDCEMYIGHGRLCVCLCVCLSLAAFPHYCTDPDVSWTEWLSLIHI